MAPHPLEAEVLVDQRARATVKLVDDPYLVAPFPHLRPGHRTVTGSGSLRDTPTTDMCLENPWQADHLLLHLGC